MTLTSVGTDQPVLVILCHPADRALTSFCKAGDPVWPNDPDELRQFQINVYENLVNLGVRQMSYGRTSYAFEYTDWITLPANDEFYFNHPPGERGTKRVDPVYDALPAAAADGWDLNAYDAFVICVATETLRGWATTAFAGSYVPTAGGFGVELEEDKHYNVVSVDAHWGRRSHELGHHLGLTDFYGQSLTIATASAWGLSGRTNEMPLPSAWFTARKGWYEEHNVRRLEWDGNDFDEVMTVRAHDVIENGTPTVYHVIEITVGPGVTYYVEVRQRPPSSPTNPSPPPPPELATTSDDLAILRAAYTYAAANPETILFDRLIPGVSSPEDGGVVVLKVIERDQMDTFNQRMRRVTTLGPQPMTAVGDVVVDAARGVSIEIERRVQIRPLTYDVRVRWTPPTGNPNGLVNLFLRPWDEFYQSPDIWIDSEHNGWGVYEEGVTDGDVVGTGDRPWIRSDNSENDEWNRFYARVWNGGSADANDVQVTFYVNDPPAIGDRGTWLPLAVETIPVVPALGFADVFTKWQPIEGRHTCLRAAAAFQVDEIDVTDNTAQGNVFKFLIGGGSPHRPVVQTVSVQNPLDEPVMVHIRARGLPFGWELTVEHEWLWLPALGERTMRVALITDYGRDEPVLHHPKGKGRRTEIPREARVTVEGLVFRSIREGPNVEGEAEHLVPIGGLTLAARVTKAITVEVGVPKGGVERERLLVEGRLAPPLADVEVALEVYGTEAGRELTRVVTGPDGSFRHAVSTSKPAGGERVTVQAFVHSSEVAADAESDLLVVEGPDSWYLQ